MLLILTREPIAAERLPLHLEVVRALPLGPQGLVERSDDDPARAWEHNPRGTRCQGRQTDVGELLFEADSRQVTRVEPLHDDHHGIALGVIKSG